MITTKSFIMSPNVLLTLFVISLFCPSHAIFSKPISREDIGLKADDQLTHLSFYFHDIVSGPNPSVVQIAKPSNSSNSGSSFGTLSMIDDPLTEGPENTSKLVGRAQGMYARADQNSLALTMIMNFLFLEGDYNGSTLSVLGRNPVNDGVRELPVVGGTGAFRFAKGYAQAKTQTLDQSNAVVHYDVYVSHAGESITSGSGDGGSGTTSNGGGGGSTSSSHGITSRTGFVLFSTLVSLILTSSFVFSLIF